ncbi:leucine rich repeat domain containing protein [Grosmannia clavigera kw1407]|uniref:Leucine rich repeat domain containing protein n=1 Tax=Grosmannia clavigera (strain kw1407 / UAMH 11150) TaxID=655863 RepID=F0XHL6_GROCL|nr:leucine rich repeat domain containing protein [Grosmannia clavigera kw1407]EFX02749.1 leucine rich repeat domain containing protein [Grosmannia clavigera kw1407]
MGHTRGHPSGEHHMPKMDMLRRNRSQLLEQPSSASTTPTISKSFSSATLNRYKLQASATSTSTPTTSSPASSVDSGHSNFFQSHMPKALRSLSRGSTSSSHPSAARPDSPSSTSPQRPFFSRNVLRKSHKRVPSGHEFLGRRGSAGSDAFSRLSRASTTMSGSSSSNFIDWRVQAVEKHTPLDYADPQTSRIRAGYLVTTADYILVFGTGSDAFAAFPHMADADTSTSDGNPVLTFTSMLPPADPLHVISLHAVISMFRGDRGRGPSGIEICWRLSYPAIATSSVRLFFNDERAREALLDHLVHSVKAKRHDQPDAFRVGCEVEDCIRRIFKVEEPTCTSSEPEIFPVAYRNAPERHRTKGDDKPKKGQQEGAHSHYLAIGVNLCYMIEIGRASITQSSALEVRYQTCGLVTLESFHADWAPRDERFSMRFRDPFKHPILLELASHQYRRIILTLTKADKFLKPAWPTPWQTQEVFHVKGLPIYQQIAAGEDFGGFQRTLTAFCAGYRCDPVDWEISWRTTVSPEFRVLPSSKGVKYTDLQLLAVLRALRYNDYFKAISFRDVDLSSLLDRYDSTRTANIAYMSRYGVCLTTNESALVQKASLMHQEFHALAFASGKIRQIDFTNCLHGVNQGNDAQRSVQFLVPILNLLAAGLTRCNRLILRGCALGDVDIDSLVTYISPSAGDRIETRVMPSHEAVGIEALDVSQCSLSEKAMKTLFQALSQSAWTLQELDISHNFGRVPAPMAQSLMDTVDNLRHLNLSGSLVGSFEGELLPLASLNRLSRLEHLDISNFKLNENSMNALGKFMTDLSACQMGQDNQQMDYYNCSLRKVVLNNCGITGDSAGRIFSAMGGLYGVHLYLNSNPLEVGIAGFIQALEQCWGGRFGLHMDMVEFQEEENYIDLIRALTTNRYIDYLSLVGSAPMPTTDDTCSDQTCSVLESFFRENQSVRYLDLSGFCGKLDDGQLGKGAGRALRGLSNNKTLTHLRIRNQNLHDSTGILGELIQNNSTLRYLDCGDNGFNLTSQRFMTKSLEGNNTLLMYAIAPDEVEQVLRACLKDMPAPAAHPSTSKQKKSVPDTALENQRAMLCEEIEASTAEILSYTSRNRANLEHATGCILELDEATDTGGTGGWPSLQLIMPEGIPYASAIQDEAQNERQVQNPTQTDRQLGNLLASAPTAQEATLPRPSLLSSALSAGPGTVEKPYKISHDDEVLHSPTEGSNAGWSLAVTPGAAPNEATESSSAAADFIEKAFFSEPDVTRILESFTLDSSPGYVVCGRT